MLILGLNAYHGDSAACLMRDGKVVAAAEEERFRRVKHWAGLPTQAIDYCLREAGAKLGDIDHIGINRKPRVNNLRRLGFVLSHRPDPRLMLAKLRNIGKAATVESALRKAYPRDALRARVHAIEHHLAHLASAFLVSPFEQAVCLSVDGFGDFASAAWGMGRGNEIQIDGRVYFPHSLGIFYSAITQFIGFPHFGDEYKVMGLAPYGTPRFLPQMRDIVRVQSDGTFRLNLRYFRHHNENVSYSWNDCSPEVGTLYRGTELERLLGRARQPGEPLEQRHKDLAHSAQAMYEEAFFALLKSLHARYGCAHLALSGGCAMNSVANGKVYLRSPFKKMYLPAAAGDAGGAIGCAFTVWHALREGDRPRESQTLSQHAAPEFSGGTGDLPVAFGDPPNALPSDLPPPSPAPRSSLPARCSLLDAYLGPQFSNAEIDALLRTRGLLSSAPGGTGDSPVTFGDSPDAVSRLEALKSRLSTFNSQPPDVSASAFQRFSVSAFQSDFSALARDTARAISEGKVVGWFQGRMEWGPRALGNRSILGDPRRADMKDILNLKIKRRESFRPFAPSILREHVAEWFEQEDDVPFMMQVFQVRPEKRGRIPAVTHIDGSGRLQTVHRETNPRYHELISAFFSLTSVPLILNTSFNENEPVVCRPGEALDCFLRTKMDVLVLGDWLIERTAPPASCRSSITDVSVALPNL